MNERPKISGGQLTALLFAGRMSGCLLLSSEGLAHFSVVDCLLSAALNGLLLFFLFLPTLRLLRTGETGTTERVYARSKAGGKITDAAYLLLCLFILLLDIVQFSDFALKTMHEGLSLWLLSVVFVVVCVVASGCGIQAIARASTPVALFAAACLIVFAVALIPQMHPFHFSPPQTEGLLLAMKKAVLDLPRTAEVAAIGLLYPYVNGSQMRSCIRFCGLTAVFSALAIVTAVGVLGGTAGMSAYPFYTAVSAARIGVLQRLDALVVAVWLGTFFVRFTLFVQLFLERLSNLFPKQRFGRVGLALILIGAALWVQHSPYGGEWQIATAVYWVMLVGFCFGLPLILKGGDRRIAKA